MPIAYCVRSDPINDTAVSEANFTITKPAGVSFGDVDGVVGMNTDKTPLGLGWNVQYDISTIPLGVNVSRSKIVLTANAGDSSVFDSRIWRYKDASSPNLDSVTETIHKQFKFLARARDTASTQLALSTTGSTFQAPVNALSGSAAFGQVLILSTAGNGDLDSVSMWLAKDIGGSFPGTCVAKIYSPAGTSGLYTRGSLLATSSTRLANDIPNLPFPAEFVFTLPTPLPVTNGQILIVEVSFDPAPSGFFSFVAEGDTAFSNPADNALMFGPSMQAFGLPVYMNGSEQSLGNGDLDVPAIASELFTFPTFVAGNQYEIGDTDYSPDVTLANFTSWVQDGLDGRGSSNRLGFSIQPGFFFGPDPPTSGEERRWRSADHATPQTVDGESYFGTVLVVQYDAELAAELSVEATVDATLRNTKLLAAELTVDASMDAHLTLGIDLAAELSMEVSIEGRLSPETIGYIVQVAAAEIPVGVATASVEAVLSSAVTVAQIQTSPKTVATLAATLVSQVRAATLAVRVAAPELAVEVSTAIVQAAVASATTVAEVQSALQTVTVQAATLVAEVQSAALVAEVRAATLIVRIETSRTSGTATEDSVAETLDISPAEIDVEVTRRDSMPFSFTLQDEDGVAINITGYDSFTLTVDPSEEPSDTDDNLFKITAAFPSPASGTITFSPSIANHTQDPGDYFFDVEQIDDSSNVRTIIKGKYTILPDITQP